MELTPYSRDKVEALLRAARANPQDLYTPELRHFFAPGLYGREMFMRAGSLVVGGVHLKEHLCVVLGDVWVYSPDGLQHFEGYHTFTTQPGAQRTLVAVTDTWWTTIHGNPDDERDIQKLEARNVSQDLQTLDAFPPGPKHLEH